MPVESDADRAVFVNPDEFGALAVYTPNGGAAVPAIAGQFDNPFLAVVPGDAASADRAPTFFCAAADLPPAAAGGDAGDTLAVTVDEIDAGTYRVIALQGDGTGMVLLTLGAMED